MGLIYSNARLLFDARRQGFSFDRTVTLGRQQISIDARGYDALAKEFKVFASDLNDPELPSAIYADRFIQNCLGCTQLDSIDLSDYQEATLTHDLNLPISENLHRRYDAVIDAGTLEHIFNFPVALKNCMEMVRVGGCIMLATTANNHCGHGFYQFSPELFFRAFQPNNGFEIQRVILIEHRFPGVELSRHQHCYEVVDPDVVRSRVGLVSRWPVMIQVLAKRINDATAMESFPQQSDYERLWESTAANATGGQSNDTAPLFSQLSGLRKLRRIGGDVYRDLEKRLPVPLQQWINGRRQLRTYSLRNRKYYRPW